MTISRIENLADAMTQHQDEKQYAQGQPTLHDEKKNKIAAQLVCNLTLQQMEWLEKRAKEMFNKKNYLEII
jgi:hypothetical protein